MYTSRTLAFIQGQDQAQDLGELNLHVQLKKSELS
jgi:hypothetical protein